MNTLLLACQFLPLLGLLSIALFGTDEHKIARISFWTTQIMGLAIISLLLVWGSQGLPHYEFEWFTLYEHGEYRFPVLFYLDRIGATYLFAIWLIFSVIVRYCRHYLHREIGYKRFFINIFAFAFGLNMVVLAGSIDMLFAGWEIVGIASFLLIAFYRHRPQPVRNALRAYTVYRFCDIGLLLGALMSHLLFHESDHFSQMAVLFEDNAPEPASYLALYIMSVLIFTAACGKSAQFPFCFWLPRAMEGPTPSSAIFYGSLSVHLGVFLLLRTEPIWNYHFITRASLFLTGLFTVVVASLSEKTQANIKGQVAYASIAQVGLMFMELSLGLDTLVLIHFLGNAFLRCYQLLVSPSIVAHMLRVEGSIDRMSSDKLVAMPMNLPATLRDTLPEVLQNTLLVFALQEGNLEFLSRSVFWTPFKRFGRLINSFGTGLGVLAAIWLLIINVLKAYDVDLNPGLLELPTALFMVLASLSAFSQKHHFIGAWNAAALSGLMAGASVGVLYPQAWLDIALFATGIVPSWLLGFWVLTHLPEADNFRDSPFAYRALAETHPRLSILMTISFLGLVGFPITPAFIGEDLLLYHASGQYVWLAALIAVCFVFNGIALARLFLRICMGNPVEICPASI